MATRRILTNLLLPVLLIVFAASAVGASPPSASLRANGVETAAGEEFSVLIYGTELDSLAAIDINVYYDAEIFSVASAESANSGVLASINASVAGEVCYSMLSVTGLNNRADFMLLTMSVSDNAPEGTYYADVMVGDAYNEALSPIQVSGTRVEIKVSKKSPVPESVSTYLECDKDEVNVNDEFTLNYGTYDSGIVAGGTFEVYYDAELLELKSIILNEDWASKGVASINIAHPGYACVSLITSDSVYANDIFTLDFVNKADYDTEASVRVSATELYTEDLLPLSAESAVCNVNVREKIVYPSLTVSVQNSVYSHEEFDVYLQIKDPVLLGAADFTLSYDSNVLECTEEAEIHADVSATGGMIVTNPNYKDGAVKFSYLNESGLSSDVNLIKVRFKAKDNVDATTAITASAAAPVDIYFNGVHIVDGESSISITVKKLNVTFKNQDGSVIVSAAVPYGTSAEAPEAPRKDSDDEYHYTFLEWDSDFSCVTEDIEIFPVYASEKHTHAVDEGFDADCLNPGESPSDWCPVCSKVFVESEVIPPLGHDTVTHGAKAPTCTEIGWNVYETCSRCDYTTYVELPANGHTDGAPVTENNTTPTCTTNGSYDTVVYCAVCKAELSRETTTVPATGHSMGKWTETLAPTCTTAGTERRDCDHCNHYETREVAALGHDKVQHEAKAPTCTEIGWNAYETCSRCDYTTYAEIPAKGHKYGSVVTAPTCTEKGYTTYTCHCGDTYVSDYVDATGHSYGKWSETLAPTCTAVGSERRDCDNCDHYETREVAALGHDKVTHDAKAPTCTEIGWNAYETCSRCDYTTYVELPANGHKYGTVVTAPTCTEKGYTTYTCHCGDSYVSDYVNATGHVAGEASSENVVEATCGENGSFDSVTYCTVCKAELSRITNVIPATERHVYIVKDHWPVGTGHVLLCNVNVTCENCTFEDDQIFEFTSEEYDPGNCQQPRITRCTAKLPDDFRQKYGIDTLYYDHTEEIGSGDPERHPEGSVLSYTDLGDGSHKYEYSCCKKSYTEEHISGDEATCTAPQTCTKCNAVIKKATGHTFGKWTETLAPACTTVGSERRDCDNCEHYETREVPALGHDFADEWTVDVEPTTTTLGQKSRHCSRCDEVTDIIEIAKIVEIIDTSKKFTDVSATSWAKEGIDYVVSHGYMNGTGNGSTFSPSGTMSRSMIVTVLYRIAGQPSHSGNDPFTDISTGWYYDAVLWAYENGIVTGTSKTTFAPDGAVTREQMATFLYRFANYMGYNTGNKADLTAFPDASKVGSWAYEALAWANAEGLITGAKGSDGVTRLDPQGNATREQVATILMRFCKAFEE